ncbi:MAG: transcriptional regulator [Gammaproteobacteria bacterium]
MNTARVSTKIQKWGNGLALRISGLMRDIPHFNEGTPVEIEISEDGFVVKKVVPKKRIKKKLKLPYSEKKLLEDLEPYRAHVDLLASISGDEF